MSISSELYKGSRDQHICFGMSCKYDIDLRNNDVDSNGIVFNLLSIITGKRRRKVFIAEYIVACSTCHLVFHKELVIFIKIR